MSSAGGAGHSAERLPGNPMMWILIGSELAVFGMALLAFQLARIVDGEMFAQSQTHLDRWAGTVNTAILLTSGYLAARAVAATRREETSRSRWFLAGASALGLVFLVVKMIEYAAKAADGLSIETNTFFTLYYLITGFHALHVVFGLILLAIAMVWNDTETLESVAAFWHMVDLVWVLIFPVIYLAP